MKNIFKLFIVIVILSSCASNKNKAPDNYTIAMKNLKAGNYFTAAEMFEKIEDENPFTEQSSNGLIMSAYSYYKAKQYEDSIRVIDYFAQSNPINDNLEYMYYLKSLDYYDRIQSMNKARDITENANLAFEDLLYKYPNTKYKYDVEQRLKKVETFLSGNELNIANYYLKRQNYIGAINHFINIINDYPNSNFVPEALYRLIQINKLLGLKSEAEQYQKILFEKFKDSKWVQSENKNLENI